MPSPGDVIVAVIPGAQKTKPRPRGVLSSSLYHSTRPDIVAGLVTSHIAAATSPSDCVLADWRPAGLVMPSAFRANISTHLASRCRVIGRLSAADWQALQRCVLAALELS